MTLAVYTAQLEVIKYGKRLPNALYILRDPALSLGSGLDSLLQQLISHLQITPDYNLLKFRTDELKLSFLAYPDFLSLAHPILAQAITIDLVTRKTRHTNYTSHLNPPILHRKETFLPPGHPLHPKFAALTAAEEAAGLYTDTTTIGFKLNWEKLLQEKGLTIEGHTLHRTSPTTDPTHGSVPFIERHKTALTRYELSKPVKTLLEYGLLKPGRTLFDYGCGPGSDVRGLEALGFSVQGWDPVYRPDTPKTPADLVNLGYVINVIEDPAERIETLVEAYSYATQILVVSALICETVETARATTLADGVLTRRNTFQKYFDQSELQQLIEDTLDTTAVPVALGIFYVFRDPSAQQDFLSARIRRSIDWTQISARLGLGTPGTIWKHLYQTHQALLGEFGKLALNLGHFPTLVEFPRLPEIEKHFGSDKRALRAYVQGSDTLGLDWNQVRVKFGIGQPSKPQWETIYEQNRQLLDSFWQVVLQLGRLPELEEYPQTSEILEKIGSLKKALRILIQKGGQSDIDQSAENRRRDLLVYVAMANLRKRVPFSHLSGSLRADIRAFFGNYTRALEKGLELLYAAGDPGEIEVACENLMIGWQDEQALYIHRSLLNDLPAVLRTYVGCATTLFGDAAQADVIKIHKTSGKVTFLAYNDFMVKAEPTLRQRTKVNLRTQWVQVFDHSVECQHLTMKDRYLQRLEKSIL